MNIKYIPTVDFFELRAAIKLQYNVDIELYDLFPEYKNDSYEAFYFGDLAAECEDEGIVDAVHLTASYLADILPSKFDYCLVGICW